jgi:methyl-accepting chemotaxis protein-2 (aspartate sensor receptor)
MISFNTFGPWNWLIAGGTYTEEITREAQQLRSHYALIGVVALLVFAVMLYLLVRTVVTRPLALAEQAAGQIAAGDLNVHLVVQNQDEIGKLLGALNGISQNLSAVVGQVRRALSR